MLFNCLNQKKKSYLSFLLVLYFVDLFLKSYIFILMSYLIFRAATNHQSMIQVLLVYVGCCCSYQYINWVSGGF